MKGPPVRVALFLFTIFLFARYAYYVNFSYLCDGFKKPKMQI